jgi:hypothetical protein
MAFKTFAPGVLTSSDVNTFLMRQSVIVCTAATRPASPNEGMTIYETDTDLLRSYSGTAWEVIAQTGAWTAWTPTLVSVGAGTDWALGNGTSVGAYARQGRTLVARFVITFGSTSTFGTKTLAIGGVPVGMVTPGSVNPPLGVCISNDVSLGNGFGGHVTFRGGLELTPLVDATSLAFTTRQEITSTVPFTWATTDTLAGTFIAETTT